LKAVRNEAQKQIFLAFSKKNDAIQTFAFPIELLTFLLAYANIQPSNNNICLFSERQKYTCHIGFEMI